MSSGDTSSGSGVVTVDVTQAKNLLDNGHSYLDVRTEEEFRNGHSLAPKIFNIPYLFYTPQGKVKNSEFLNQVSSLLKTTDDIVVGCQGGGRSLQATSELRAAGFEKVSNMGGGYLAWTENKFPVQKGAN